MFDSVFDREAPTPAAYPLSSEVQSPVTETELRTMFKDVLLKAPRLDDFGLPQAQSTGLQRLQKTARRRRLVALAELHSNKVRTILHKIEEEDKLQEADAHIRAPALNQTKH